MFDVPRIRRWLTSVTGAGDGGLPLRMLGLYAGKERLHVFPINEYQHSTGIADILEKCKDLSEDDTTGNEPHKTTKYQLKGFFGENVESTKFCSWTLTKEPEGDEGDDAFAGAGASPKDILGQVLHHGQVMHSQGSKLINDLMNKLRAENDALRASNEAKDDRIDQMIERERNIKIREQEYLDREAERKQAAIAAEEERKAEREKWDYGKMAGMILLQHITAPKQLPANGESAPAQISAMMAGLKTLIDTMTDEEVKGAFPHMTPTQVEFVVKCNEMKNKETPGPAPSLNEINDFLDSLLEDPERTRAILSGFNILKQGYIGGLLSQRALSRPQKPILRVVQDKEAT